MASSGTPSQAEYQPTPYEDASFEVVGELKSNDDFIPLEVEVLRSDETIIDPMFQDYGGRANTTPEKRWHLPEHVSYSGPRNSTDQAKDDTPDSTIRITPEELARLKQEAFEAGRQHGALETVEKQNSRLSEIEHRIMNIISDVSAQESEYITAIAQDASALAVSISQRIIDHTVEINPDYIVTIVQEALRHTGGARVRRIKVSPQDLEFIEVIGVGKRLKEYDGTWQFEADESIRKGCVIETSAGEVDFNLDQAWERVRDSVLKVMK